MGMRWNWKIGKSHYHYFTQAIQMVVFPFYYHLTLLLSYCIDMEGDYVLVSYFNPG